MVRKILNKKQEVYCASVGIGDNREFKLHGVNVGTIKRRYGNRAKGKVRVEIGAGHFKNYHMPLVVKSIKQSLSM